MDMITTKDGVSIYFKDLGPKEVPAIVFHHGWLLSADDWDNQMMFFLAHGYRVIAHDRRGHGRSTQRFSGDEMDTYAADVAQLRGAHFFAKYVSSCDGRSKLNHPNPRKWDNSLVRSSQTTNCCPVVA